MFVRLINYQSVFTANRVASHHGEPWSPPPIGRATDNAADWNSKH